MSNDTRNLFCTFSNVRRVSDQSRAFFSLWKCRRHLNRRTNQGEKEKKRTQATNKHWIVCFLWANAKPMREFVWCSEWIVALLTLISLWACLMLVFLSLKLRLWLAHSSLTRPLRSDYVLYVLVKTVIIYEQIACNSPITSRKEWNQQQWTSITWVKPWSFNRI